MSEQPVAPATADPSADATPAAVVDPPSATQVLSDVEAAAKTAGADVVTGVEQTAEKVATDVHPAVAEVLQFFDPSHLPSELAAVAAPFQSLAHSLASSLKGSQLTLALHHLLASKDSAVRAKVAADASASDTAAPVA